MGRVIKLFFVMALLLSGCAVRPGPGHQFELLEGPVVTQAIITLPTRPGVQQRVLIVQAEGESKGTLVLFPGGNGAGHFQESGRGVRLSANFLVRSSELFAQEGFTAAIVDTPSDLASGMSDGSRTSPQHLAGRPLLDGNVLSSFFHVFSEFTTVLSELTSVLPEFLAVVFQFSSVTADLLPISGQLFRACAALFILPVLPQIPAQLLSILTDLSLVSADLPAVVPNLLPVVPHLTMRSPFGRRSSAPLRSDCHSAESQEKAGE